MPDRTFSRRQFLRLTAGTAMALTVATTVPPRTVQADETPPLSLSQVGEILDDPEVQKWIATGFGPLFVAGRFLDTFGRDLAFDDLPAPLRRKYLRAGAELKAWPEAQAIYKTIPAQVRAAGPDALWRFHKGQDWSHIVPRTLEGPTTAKNGIWWTAGKNRSLGPNPMGPADIADARNLLRRAAIRAAITQTAKAMGMGALAGVVVAGTLFSLQIGLQYAEGKITRQEMIEEMLSMTLFAGVASFVITGLIVGLPLMFPFLIPIITPVLFVLQIVGLVFLGGYSLALVKGWLDFLNDQGLLDGFNDVLETTEDVLGRMYGGVLGGVLATIRGWVEQVARFVGVEKAWQLLTNLLQEMGTEQALIWVAARSSLVTSKAAAVMSSLNRWNYEGPELNMDPAEISRSIGRVVTSEFETASATVGVMRRSISEYRESANLKGANLLLAVS